MGSKAVERLLERAIFYDKNPDAAKGKRWAKDDRTAGLVSTAVPVFPTSGWSSDLSVFPTVTSVTILGHLLSTGVRRSGNALNKVKWLL